MMRNALGYKESTCAIGVSVYARKVGDGIKENVSKVEG